MAQLTTDVCIAGRGPAGIIAARQLVLAGFSVIIIDNPNHKIHKFGETLPSSAIRLLTKLGLQSVIETLQKDQNLHQDYSPRVSGNMSFWGSDTALFTDALQDPYGFGLRIDRQVFDALLAQQAQIDKIPQFSTNILDLKKIDNNWNVHLECGTSISAKWIIDATGRSAKISRLLGIERHRGIPLVAVYRSCTPEKNISFNKTIISSDKNGWLYAGKISESHWVIGYHTTPKIASTLHNNTQNWNSILGKNTTISGLLGHLELKKDIYAHDIRSTWLKQGFGDGWIACGDALLAFDPIAGQGLFNAIYTGMKAAETIIQSAKDKHSQAQYLAEINRVIKTYENRRYALYKQEQRWLNSAFWKAHQTTTD
ncbi:FAD-dependent monooxygenase [Acinetobacter sp. ANC 3882]|uniref:FAD-dependent monooxygenase n=1 Tax=Acinetobacter sp. ANC 3882 TaxID=2923423 RepID=UPI001F4A9DBE|nr:FAD-dependent monooxygenase [Acinetobacter sp. ANC 3882]MCH7313404.1 FAD-dependent monooxygenase [Acinetobacter sp. ANC 3882]